MKNIHLRCGRAFVSLLCECLAIHDVKAFSLLLAARQNPNIYDNWLKGVFFASSVLGNLLQTSTQFCKMIILTTSPSAGVAKNFRENATQVSMAVESKLLKLIGKQ